MLANRWIVRRINPYTYDGSAPYCVECRATGACLCYGTLGECKAAARNANRRAV